MTLLILLSVAFLLPAPPPLQHPRDATPATVAELRSALAAGHVDVFGRAAPGRRLAVALAQVRLEGGGGFCHNIGSIGAVSGQPYCRVGPGRFRWFATHLDGARVYWSLLQARCSGALRFFDAGMASEAAGALRRCGYYRVEEAWYREGLRALVASGPFP